MTTDYNQLIDELDELWSRGTSLLERSKLTVNHPLKEDMVSYLSELRMYEYLFTVVEEYCNKRCLSYCDLEYDPEDDSEYGQEFHQEYPPEYDLLETLDPEQVQELVVLIDVLTDIKNKITAILNSLNW